MAKTDLEIVSERDGESGFEDEGLPPGPSDTAYTSEESELKAGEGDHKKGTTEGRRGRPVKVEKTYNPAMGVPGPKFRLFKSDATNPHQRFKPFCNYWNDLPQWAKENTLLYVYREHPVLLFVERDPEGKQKDFEFNYIDKISGAEPLQDESDLLNRYGCGNYKLVFNAIEANKPNRTLCTVYAVSLGGGDFKSNPPTDRRISDSKNVDMNHPSNASYIAYLRGQGLLPNQIDAIKGEADVATIELAKEQQKTTDKLLDAVLEKNKTPPPVADPGFMERAVSGAMEVVKEGSKAAIKITQDANEYANRIREQVDSKAPVATSDPMALALQIVELIRGGSKENSPEVSDLRREIDRLRAEQDKSRDEQLKLMRDELRELRTRPAESVTGNPFANLESGMSMMKKMKEMTDEIAGSGKEPSVAEDVADAAGAPKWLVRFAPLMQQGLSVVDTFLRMRSGQAQTPPPQQYQQQPGGYPPPQWNGPGPQYQPQPQAPMPMPNPPGPQLVQARHPLGTLDYTQFTPELAQLLSSIAVPLAMHLSDDQMTGTDFAEWFMGGFGDATHAQIAAFGENVVAALYSYPPTLQAIQGFPPEQVQAFVAEFLNPQFEDEASDGEVEPEEGIKEPVKEPQPA